MHTPIYVKDRLYRHWVGHFVKQYYNNLVITNTLLVRYSLRDDGASIFASHIPVAMSHRHQPDLMWSDKWDESSDDSFDRKQYLQRSLRPSFAGEIIISFLFQHSKFIRTKKRVSFLLVNLIAFNRIAYDDTK